MAIQALLAALGPMLAKGGAAAGGASTASQLSTIASSLGQSGTSAIRHTTSGISGMAGGYGGGGPGHVASGMLKSAGTIANPLSPIATMSELATLPATIRDWGLALKESQRALKDYSGAMAEIFAYSEYRDLLRQRKVAQETAGTTGYMVGNIDDLQDQLQPIGADVRNIANMVVGKLAETVGVAVTLMGAIASVLLPGLSGSIKEILTALRSDKTGKGRPPVASFIDYIMDPRRGLGSDIPLGRGYIPPGEGGVSKEIMDAFTDKIGSHPIWKIPTPWKNIETITEKHPRIGGAVREALRSGPKGAVGGAIRGALWSGDDAAGQGGGRGAGGGGPVADDDGIMSLSTLPLTGTPSAAGGPWATPSLEDIAKRFHRPLPHRFGTSFRPSKFRTAEDEARLDEERSDDEAYEEMLRRRSMGVHFLAAGRRRARRARLGRDAETGRRFDTTPDRVAESVDWSRAAAIRERARLARVPRLPPK